MMMHFDEAMSPKPRNLQEVKGLRIDRKASFRVESQTVCLDLDGTLCRILDAKNARELRSEAWLLRGVKVSLTDEGIGGEVVILPRPGAAEFLLELRKYADPVIYTDLTDASIDKIMTTLSIAQQDLLESDNFEKSEAFMDIFTWSKVQCVKTNNGYQKSLGHFSEHCQANINRLWLVTDKPEMVDLKERVVTISRFNGDPNDTALYELTRKIFIN